MWIRLRLDIGWLDLAYAILYGLLPGKRELAVQRARQSWKSQDDFLITLSVRSAFDLLLRALELPHGSEVLFSALTVPDMVRIAEMHGLVAVPVDTDQVGNVDSDSLRRAISPRSKIVVVAHLYGGRAPLDDVFNIATENHLLVVEDCAQSYCCAGGPADPQSDIAMFSFGPIKTTTALGGAVVRVKSPALHERMAALFATDPIQSRTSFMRRVFRFAVLKMISGKWFAAWTQFVVKQLGGDFDRLINSAVRGFSSANLLAQLRRQPSVPLLRLLERRWRFYDFRRIADRIQMGKYFDSCLGLQHAESHSYWIYPIFVPDPVTIRDRLRAAGFDATCQSRMTVVTVADDSRNPTSAIDCWKHILFLPWYPDLPQNAIHEMAIQIRSRAVETGPPGKAQRDIESGSLNDG